MIKELIKSIKQYKNYTILAPVFMLIEVALEVCIPFFMSLLIDEGIYSRDMNSTIKIGSILLGLTLATMISGIISGTFSAKAASGFATNLRQDIYNNVQNFSFSNIDKFSPASIVTRLTTDITNILNAFQIIIRMAVRAPFMIVLSFLMSFNINPSLSMIFLVAMPLLALGMYLVMSNAHPIFVRVFKTYDKLNAIVQENLRGIRVVKSFVREDHEKDKFKKISESIYKDFLSAEKILAFNAPIMQFCMYGCILLISWLGARFIVAGNMSTGQLASFISYTLQILLSLMMLAMVFIMIVISKASAARIVEILKERPNIKNPNSPIYKVKDGSITFNNVSFSYVNDMNRLCLSSVNLKINSGETVGIIGSTGSSKSTLVQLIPRLYDATYGAVYVGGSNVRDYDIQALRASVAFVLQQNVLFSGTIKENLLWGNKNATDEELIETAKLAQAHDFIMSFEKGYDSMLEQGASNLSGGQKQRICIARALLKKPKILILDDSTSAVDTKTDSLIRKALREYIPETTKIIIAQRISSVEDADKIMVIDNGKINAFGTHEELISANYIYQDIYNSQIKGGGDFDEQ